ncbi:TetR/AcrR family transcriptional regulator [Rhodoplanes sp. TEM]|uniref:TetR/AcrR family transcriptional regulator n=1 Tax=Rhodoplanes tepidamans TaxID=200616 RepID=A0ABT5J3T6_RHOTP|nr:MULTISPECIES: TetR/AcrR family transcriptional regulator [Rhodoplanes]MDC7784319.1 TetR/AcrR family transcriptional regulator [Rhodoplanes tepidamans]MDC7987819.1 TetR/AcrR family transcriptional regulator [Rhodoplanes sp. TEM]MDQ0353722.1 AcrR family transcriptional regulator [Rhodoplanes tepidamans]
MNSPASRRRRSTVPGDETRERLLDAAERLFAERGYANVSTRDIAEAARSNAAAAHYHFGSKEALLEAVFKRRLDGVNAERERLLAECVAAAGGRPDIADVLEAFIGPTLRLGATEEGHRFNLLAGRSSTDPNPEVRRIVFGVYDSVGRCFVEAAAAACPDLSKDELFWRIACVYGAMMYIRADNGRLQHLFGPGVSLSDSAGALRYAMPFLTAGMRAPPAAGTE